MARTFPPRSRGRLIARGLAVVAAGVIGGSLALPTAPVANAADTDDSAVTIAWAGGNAPELQRYQPDHEALTADADGNDAGSGHWDDFEDLQISVSKTRGLRDEVVTVSATGMNATAVAGGAKNFLQVFQCWGQDPLGDAFAETCQFGSWNGASGSRSGGGIPAPPDTFSRGSFGAGDSGDTPEDLDPRVPFKAVWGEYSEPIDAGAAGTLDGTSAFFTDATSNEQPFVAINERGNGTTSFEVQSAASAPHLGCGDPESVVGARCWLVVVPRGEHSGTPQDSSPQRCAGESDYGQETAQRGSPLERRDCTFWSDRVVVPLDFDNPFLSCRAGNASRQVSGSELLSEAMSSWQSVLCTREAGATYSLTTNSGNLTRSQLLTGQIPFAAVARTLTPETIGTTDPALLEDTDIRYAPIVNSGVVIAYISDRDAGRVQQRDLRLTPRLVAKLLTQSYFDQIPRYDTGTIAAHAADRPRNIMRDPEWGAIGNYSDSLNDQAVSGSFVVSGPAGDDAIRLLWEYVQADRDAVAFLRGEPDPWGMTINPYYLPEGHSRALGGGLPVDLAVTPMDAFLKADQTLSPGEEESVALEFVNGQQIDSVSAFPFSNSLQEIATRVFRGDTKRTTFFDKNKENSAGGTGAYVAAGPQGPALGRFTLGPTTLAAAERYSLATMALSAPSSMRTTRDDVGAKTFTMPTVSSMDATIRAQKVDPLSGVATPDFANIPSTGYPLSMTILGAVDITNRRIDQATRNDYARFIRYAAVDGQVPGVARGELPDGYAPLTEEQRDAALRVAANLEQPLPAEEGAEDAASASVAAAQTPAQAAAAASGTPSIGPATSVATAPDAALANETSRSNFSQVLGGALIAGAIGAIASPFLLRRRRGAG